MAIVQSYATHYYHDHLTQRELSPSQSIGAFKNGEFDKPRRWLPFVWPTPAGVAETWVCLVGGVMPPSARWPETTVLVSAGQSRTIDVVADNPGDWAFYRHMTHHVTNQMGHQGIMVGADAASLKQAIKPLIPDYIPMGTTGMNGMTEMRTGIDMRRRSARMATPENSIAMMGNGPHGIIGIGGMLTVLKVREHLTSYTDPGLVSGAARNRSTVNRQTRPPRGRHQGVRRCRHFIVVGMRLP